MTKKTALALFTFVLAAAVAHGQTNARTNRPRQGGGGFGGFGPRIGPPPAWIEPGYDDHQNMMHQLGIKSLRPGRNGQKQEGPGFEEATANAWMPTLPDALTMKDGAKVTTPDQWPARRAEIVEDFEREVYGRIPADVPKVTWEVTATRQTNINGIAAVKKTLVGHVDNSAFTNVKVDIQASYTVPANAPGPVPILIQFGGFFFPGRFGGAPPPRGIPEEALSHGWGFGTINPNSIQADTGGFSLRLGIIGLANKGQPRKPDDWGSLRAWGWGISRMIDYFESNPDSKVDPKKVGIEGVSRYGKAALVTEAFDPRVAVALVGSSGEGGAKLHRHDFGESVENLTGSGEYHWMAGNFLKYGAADINGKSMSASDLPVDSHELIALCAPRPCFISYGVVAMGDAKWIDAAGGYRAGILASRVYALLGAKGYGSDVQDWVHAEMPPVGTLVGGELAFRQHEGGHTDLPNIPPFFNWIDKYIKSPMSPAPSAAHVQ